jgi:hypothetical protein
MIDTVEMAHAAPVQRYVGGTAKRILRPELMCAAFLPPADDAIVVVP